MRARSVLCAIVAVLTTSGCRIDSLEGAEYAGPKNQCAVGCPTGSLCADGACVAEQTNYPLLLEATPPSSSRFGAGVTFTFAVDDRRAGNRDLPLPRVARVSGRLDAATSLPLVLRLERVGAVRGTASASFEAKTIRSSPIPTTPPLTIPPGNYHAFVAPANDADLTVLPPVQLRDDATREPLVVNFGAGNNELQVAYGATLRKLDVALVNEAGGPLVSPNQARDIYVQDVTTGRLASTIAHTCLTPGENLASEVTLVLAPELAGHRYSLRIDTAETSCSAAATPVRSTLEYDLQALDVEGRGNRVTLTVPQLTTTIATGVVKAFGKSTPISGKLVLRSVKLDHTSDDVTGRLASTVTTSIREGTFSTLVIPGTYRADVIPTAAERDPSSAFSICVDCTVPSQDPSAKPGTRVAEFVLTSDSLNPLAFEVPQRVQLRASAGGFDGALFTVGTWEASSATSGGGLSALGSPLLTRAQTGKIRVLADVRSGAQWNVGGAPDGSEGEERLDPGLYDLIVRSPEASGYPWIVRPRFEVLPQATLDAGAMKATAPVVITGTVTDPDNNAVPRAAVRARALIILEGQKEPSSAVFVGETRADEFGRYRLLVPSAFATASKGPTT